MTGDAREAVAATTEILHREAMLLDERRWDEWLDLFAPDCEFWVPMWRTEDELTTDPHGELSHIFYASRAGLEDRIIRIRSGASPATVPMPRTTHLISSVIAREPPSGDEARLRSAWACHVFYPRSRSQHAFFGATDYLMRRCDGRWLIQKKHISLLNDYIPSMLDIYCI